jgi:hypothetical protein
MEFVPGSRGESLTDEATATGRLLHEIEIQAQGGPNVEPPTAAMFQAILLEKDDPSIAYLLDGAASHALVRRGVSVGAATSALRTSFVDYFRAYYRQEFGEEFPDATLVSAEQWKPNIDLLKKDLLTDRSMAVSQLYSDITFREAATPIKERYFPPALIAHLVQERMTDQPWRVLDIGSSVPVGALQLRYQHDFPMSMHSVTELDARGAVAGDLTDRANDILSRPQLLGEIVCVDQYPVFNEKFQRFDEAYVEYALSGLRPSERSDHEYFNTLKALIDRKRKYYDGQTSSSYDPDNGVTFHTGNLLHKHDLGTFKELFPEPFDLIIMNYVTQELATEQQIKLDRITDRLLSPEGIKIYNHQAYLVSTPQEHPAPISDLRHWQSYATEPYRSNMHLRDNLHPVPGLQEPFNYLDNRCQTLRVSAYGKLVVNGELEPIADLIKNS